MSEATITEPVWTSICESYKTREDWLANRKRGIGASETAGIFGVGYAQQSPITIWSDKTGGPKIEFDDAALKRLKRGRRMESVIAEDFADETGLLTMNPGEFTVFYSRENPFILTTLDRFCLDPDHGYIPVEIKNVNGRFRNDWDESEEPPLKYQIQCQQQMYVTGTNHVYLVGLIGGDELVIRLLERNQPFIDAMVSRLTDFWTYVQTGEMPPIDESEATKTMLGLIWPKDIGTEVALPLEAEAWDCELLEVKEELKKLEAKKTGLENELRAAIGDASRGVLPNGGSYSWKLQRREEYVCKASEFRVLRRSNK